MIFTFGLLSFLQMVFAPGFILLKSGRFDSPGLDGKFSKIQKLVYGFGLSLLINYLLVFLLTILRIYKPLTLYIVLFIEAALIWSIIKKSPAKRCLHINIKKTAASFQNFINSNSLVYNFLLFLSLAILIYYVSIFLNSIGTAFVRWDPVVSWNRFALDWADNQLPTLTWHYPQLIPANWSVSYVMMQNTDVQLFAKAIMPLFSIGTLLLFADLGLRKKNALYLLSLILYGILLLAVYESPFIISGYVDIAVSFFAFLSFHVMCGSQSETGSRDFKPISLAVIFASAAAVTKQAGLYILAFILVWAGHRFFENRKTLSPKKITGRLLLMLLVVIIIAGSWYTLKEIQIQSGKDHSEIHGVQRMHDKYSPLKRLNYGANLLFNRIQPPFFFYTLVFLIVLGLFHKHSRAVTIFIAIPYTLLWGIFFSYDPRNLLLAIPFTAFSAAFGAAVLKKALLHLKKLPRCKIPILPLLISTLLTLIVLSFTLLKDQTLIQQQTRQKEKLGRPGLNHLLYQYHRTEGIKGGIATKYTVLKYLPVLGRFYRELSALKRGQVTKESFEFLDTPKGKAVHYVLLHKTYIRRKKAFNFFQAQIKNKKYRVIFQRHGYWFVQVKKTKITRQKGGVMIFILRLTEKYSSPAPFF